MELVLGWINFFYCIFFLYEALSKDISDRGGVLEIWRQELANILANWEKDRESILKLGGSVECPFKICSHKF